MDEHELTRRLTDAADAVSVGPDLAAVERGGAQRRARRRWATGVATAMLVAGAAGAGFGLGRNVSDGSTAAGDEAATEPPAPTATAPTGAPVTAAPATVPTTEPGPVLAPPPITTFPANVGPVDVPAEMVADAGAYGGIYAGGPSGPLTLRATRTLDDGIRVRVLTGDGNWAPYTLGDWQAAGWCYPTGELRLTLDGPDFVDVTTLGAYAEVPPDTGLTSQRAELGSADGAPKRVVAVQTSAEVTAITVTWDDGLVDTTEPVDGFAVLVVDGDRAWEHTYEVSATGAGGPVSHAGEALEQQSMNSPQACNPPPPALPAPGEQPADPVAAEADVVAAFDALWADLGADTESARLDDWTGVFAALDAVRTGGFAEAAGSAVHTVDEVSFTSPTEVWFRYTLTTSMGTFGERYGTATLTDAGWVFPRAVVCQDISLAGTGCQPGVAPIYPPSWYDRYGATGYGSCTTSAEGTEICSYCEVAADGTESCSEEGTMPAAEPAVGIAVPATVVP